MASILLLHSEKRSTNTVGVVMRWSWREGLQGAWLKGWRSRVPAPQDVTALSNAQHGSARLDARLRVRAAIETVPMRQALASRGVMPELVELVSPILEERAAGLSSEAHDALLDGVAMAFELQHDVSGQLAESLRGLREVERMMGAFSGELSKLDEVLEVLATYVRRMKNSGTSESIRVLH